MTLVTSPTYVTIRDQRRSALEAALATTWQGHCDFVLEIGCGHGHFLISYATAHPLELCIGIDIASDRVARANKKLFHAKLPNLRFIRAEASLFLACVPKEILISKILALFPDPWPKRRHHKHRLLQPWFLKFLASRATPDCRLHFRTDDPEYFGWTRSAIATSRSWVETPAPWPFEFATVFQSRAPRFQSLTARRLLLPA